LIFGGERDDDLGSNLTFLFAKKGQDFRITRVNAIPLISFGAFYNNQTIRHAGKIFTLQNKSFATGEVENNYQKTLIMFDGEEWLEFY
jgi:hypothetical protein